MMKKALLLLFFLCAGLVGYAQVTLSGKTVTDKGEPVPSVIVTVKKNGVTKTNTLSDFDGLYRITGLDPGTYDIEFSLMGFATAVQKNVSLTNGIIVVDGKMSDDPKLLNEFIVTEYKVPLVKVDNTQQGGTLTSIQIAKSPIKDITSLVGTAAPGVSVSANGALSVRGGRENTTDTYIDGMRVRGSNSVPANDIEQLEVITGGLEAKYGDVVNGVVNITTKGPANKFTGALELESSKYLDKFGYQFVNANVSGPIWQKQRDKFKETIIGFRLSGQYRSNLDANPPAVPTYRVKDDVLKQLEEKPISTIGNGTQVASAELLTADKFDVLGYRAGNNYRQMETVGKIDAKITKNMDVTLTGNYYRIDDQFTPSSTSSGDWQVFNSHNNPTSVVQRYRSIARLRHRLGNTEGGGKATGTVIENAQYTIQGSFERDFRLRQDPRHQDRFFDYGYVGQFDYNYAPDIRQVLDTTGGVPRVVLRHLGYRRELQRYTRAEKNPVLANYNNSVDIDVAGNNINVFNGAFNRENLRNVWTFHNNVGNVYNSFIKNDGTMMTAKVDFSFDLVPGGSKAKAHNIQFGVIYEQRDDRQYSLSPFRLWDLAELRQNDNINGTALDTSVTLRDTLINGERVKIYAPLENKDVATQTDIQFYKRYREKLGLKPLSQGNVSNLTPEQMSLDMFSARELNDLNLTSYYGFDYLGRKLTSNATFKDFFTSRDANGVRTFPVAPLNPIYVGGYIQDKFRYKDIIFSAGLRLDRYDANTKVMKDPYSLYEIMTAKEFYDNVLKTKKPDNIGDDFKVYLSTNTIGKTNYNYKEADIRAYRIGDQWYTKSGQPQDPVALFGESAQTFAKYKSDTFPTIKQLGYNSDISFEDYKPQTNIMPRLAVSFPISDVANFFAHYDVLVARPSGNNNVTALNYFYFDDVGRTPENNANLKPERTIEYEVGFQQKLNDFSAIKISSYYREMRDWIQLRYFKYLPAPSKVTEYLSYDNLDFGTVKAFTFQYDLRPINHFSGLINYTLQFADGTGSTAGSSRDLNRRGSIRVLSPLNFDERHRITARLDYRYDDGKYTGPKLLGVDIFKDAGANIQLTTVSGRPYTSNRQPQPFSSSQISGDINGARLPWNYTIDGRLDKTVSLSKNPNHPLSVNVYLRVQNLLNTQNVADVYNATGSPDDDGYLTSARGQSELANVAQSRSNDLEAYENSYMMRMLNPDFYFLPRRIFLGAIFSF